ncbi:MAG TPA: hypothetical protein VGL97_23015 [Bryobacteraceae bacterium]
MRRALWIFLSLYAAVLFSLVSKLSLWLDELIDLTQIQNHDLAGLIAYVPVNAGGVPLNYLIRFASVHLLGYSRFSERLPSLLFSLAACAGVFVLARRLKLSYPLLSILIFCSAPLQFRYALESRPYSQALAISIWATVVFLDLLTRVTWVRVFLYSLVALAGLYTQPFTIFVPLAHLVWLCFTVSSNKRRLLLFTGGAIALAGLAFVPWYLSALHLWSQSMAAHKTYAIGLRAAPMIVRELVGAGYPGSVFTLCLASIGLTTGLSNNKDRSFWALYTLLPILLAVSADAIFGYFLAIRQMIFILTPLALLAALGLETLMRRSRGWGIAAASLLIVTFLIGNVRFFQRPRENWRSASAILENLTARGSCVWFIPADSIDFYRFFAPQLPQHACPSDVHGPGAIAVAISPYGATGAANIIKQLSENGFIQKAEFNPQGPRIELYERK